MASDEHPPGRLDPRTSERLVTKRDLTLPEQHPLTLLLTRLLDNQPPGEAKLPDPDPYGQLMFKYTRVSLPDELHMLYFENDVLYEPVEEERAWLDAILPRISEDRLKDFVLVVTDGDRAAHSVVWRNFLNAREKCKVGFVYYSEAWRLNLANDQEVLLRVLKLLTFWRST